MLPSKGIIFESGWPGFGSLGRAACPGLSSVVSGWVCCLGPEGGKGGLRTADDGGRDGSFGNWVDGCSPGQAGGRA